MDMTGNMLKNLIKKLATLLTLGSILLPQFVLAANTHSGSPSRTGPKYWTAADSTDLSFTTTWTIEYWTKMNSTPASNGDEYHIFHNSSAGSFAFRWFYANVLGTLKYEMDTFDSVCNGGTAQQTRVSYTMSTGTWTHVAAVKSGVTWELFIDGVSKGTGLALAVICDGSAVRGIGATNGGSNGYDGLIDDLRIYNGTALTASQILADYNCELTDFTNLNAYWKFNNSPNEVAGVGAATDNLTEVNSPTYSTDVPFTDPCGGGGATAPVQPPFWNMF